MVTSVACVVTDVSAPAHGGKTQLSAATVDKLDKPLGKQI